MSPSQIELKAWASADFFPGEGKNFPGGGGQEPTFCLKSNEKDTIFPKKVLKHTIFGRPGGGARAPLALPCGRP